MRILVAYGSKRGGTEGLARTVGEALRAAGHAVDVRSGHLIDGLEGWDAVVVGGALYATFWQRRARRFVHRHAEELRRRPVYFFSSGPLDASAAKDGGIAPTRSVRKLMDKVGARGHVTFGGRLADDATGFIAGKMARSGKAGDWRDMERVTAWATGVAHELAALPTPAPAPVKGSDRSRRVARLLVAALCLFTGATALAGGLVLLGAPHGARWAYSDASVLRGTPFEDFVVPGLLLAGVIGLGNLVAGALAVRRSRWTDHAGFAAGTALAVWIAAETVFLGTFTGLQGIYLTVGVATMVAALYHWRERPWREWRGPRTGLPG